MRHEIHELRARELAILRDDYMTRDQLRNTFVTREETQAAAVGRRERWPIVLGGIVVVMQAAGLVLELARPH